MYEQYGLSDPFFLMLYGGAMMLALTSCCYMLVAFRSTLAAQVVPPRGLRYWTAAFYAAVAVSQSRPVTALELSQQCGYRTYRTFSTAFRQHMGVAVTEWMQSVRVVLQPS